MKTTGGINRDQEKGSSENTGADFSSKLHAGALTKSNKEKQLAAQYSLSLIKASLDSLNNTNSDEKIPDVDATLAVMKEFNSKDVEAGSADKYPCSNEMLKELIKDHERIITQLRNTMSKYYERYKDMSLRSMLNGIIQEHKAVAWTLKRYLVG
jgi:hypothetical protein